MIQIVWGLIKIFVGVSALAWLLSNPGNVIVNWQGWRIDTYTSVLVIAVVLLAWGLYRLFWFWWLVRTAPERMAQRRTHNQNIRGMLALTDGFIAVSEGNVQTAQQCLARAERNLKNPQLTGLLAVQTAQLSGDIAGMRGRLEALLDDEKTAYLGVRGLVQQAVNAGAWKQANVLIDNALELRPKSPWAIEKSLMVKARVGDFDSAMDVLETAMKAKVFARGDYRKRKADLLYHMAQQRIAKHDHDGALDYLKQGHKLDPTHVQTVTLGVDILRANQDIKTLEKWIETLWQTHPDTGLFQQYKTACMVSESKQTSRLKRLAKLNRTHPITQTMMGEYFVGIKQYENALQWLNPIVDGGNLTRQVCLLMATIEEQHRGDVIASGRWKQMAERMNEPVRAPDRYGENSTTIVA